MAYYLVRFAKQGKRFIDAAPHKQMIQAGSVALAQGQAEQIALGSGDGETALQLFNEIGLVSTRSPEGGWSG